jgi:hypothetical protein
VTPEEASGRTLQRVYQELNDAITDGVLWIIFVFIPCVLCS